MNRKKLLNFLRIIISWSFVGVVLIPFGMVVLNSLKTTQESARMNMKLPDKLHFENYMEVIEEGHMVRSFFNSLFIALFCVIIGITVSAMAAYVISRYKSKLNRFCFYFFFVGLIAPVNYVTTIRVMKWLHLINSYRGMILLNAALAIPFAVFLFHGFIITVPREIDEAGVIDGCGPASLFFRVVFPLLKPVTITAGVLTFISCWNDFITPLYILNDTRKWGMIISVYNFWGLYTSEWNLICAVIVLTLAPIMIVYILAQKYIIAGMTAGSVKG